MMGSKQLVGRLEEIVKQFGDLLGSQSQQSKSLLEEAPTADVRDLIGSRVASTSRDDMEVKKEENDTAAGSVDLRASQEPRSAYFP